MGRTHALAYQAAQRDEYPCKIHAIADNNPQNFNEQMAQGNIGDSEIAIDFSEIEFHQDANKILNNPSIDLVSICTHTDTHVDLSIRALQAGKHVLVEKPVAINPADIQRLAEVAAESDRLCIPAMCMRHWPAWIKMRELIQSNEFGRVRSAAFHRLGSRPNWSADFYADDTRSGGVLHDLHIHDTDFIVHCFGTPDAVTTIGDLYHLTSLYHYPHTPIHVTAQAAWDHQPAIGFRMRCTIVCEQATLDFDFSADNQLVVHQKDQSTPIEVSKLTGYDGEIRWVLDQIAASSQTTQPIQDALAVSKVLEAEAQSMETKSKFNLT